MEMPKASLDQLLATIPSQTRLDQNVSDDHLADIARKLTSWRVCSYLGISEAEETEIEMNHKKENQRRLAVLRKWRSKYGPTATYRNLANCFYRADMQSMVQEMCQVLGAPRGGEGGGEGSGGVSTRLLIIAAVFMALVAIITGIGLKVDDSHSWTQVPNKYAEKLKSHYRRRSTWVKDHHWPHQVPQKLYNLTLVKPEETVRGGTASISENFTRLTMSGKVKEAVRKKNPIELHQVFMKSVDKQEMTVLFEGNAGSGKSVLSLHLCLQWMDEKLFQDYKLVILIQLREPAIANAKEIKEILPRVGMEEDAAQWIESNNGSGVLFVMDGWDELPKAIPTDHIIQRIVHREVLSESAIVITSRPTSSAVLHELITLRIEILGFSPKDLHDYFTKHLGNSSSKAHTLLQKIRANPFVAETCTLPLNAAILVFIFKQEGNLPTTEHGIFDALIRNCILRHLKERVNLTVRAIKSLTDLPLLVQSQYKKICEIAYRGVMEDRIIFELSEDFETLGLLQGVECYTSNGAEYFYNFFHLSIQEVLAAHHIATAFKPAEQVAVLEKLFGKARFMSTFKHYSAITNLATPGIDKIVLQIVKRSATDNPRYADRVHLLSLLNCLREAQEPSMYKFVADNLGAALDLSYITLNRADCLSISYFFKYVAGIKVDFSKCFIDAEGCKLLFSQAQDYRLRFLDFAENAIGDEGCTALCRELQNYPKLQVLGIWRNNLTDASIKPLTELITTAKSLRRLILGGNRFTEKGKAQLQQAVKDRGPNCVKLSLSLSFY